MPCDWVPPFRPLSAWEWWHEDCWWFWEPVEWWAAWEVAKTLSAWPNIPNIDFDAIRFLARELWTNNWIIPIFKASDPNLDAKEQAKRMQENARLMKILAWSNACTIINRMFSCACVGDSDRLQGAAKTFIDFLLREWVNPMRVFFYLPFFAGKDSDKISLKETCLHDFFLDLWCSSSLLEYVRSFHHK